MGRAWFKVDRLSSLAVIVFSLACDAGYGAEITHIRLGTPDFGFLTVSGGLKAGDEQRFLSAATNYSKGAVLLKSDGGNLFSGLQIGETIRLRGFSTGVAPGLPCASACALAWLGGSPSGHRTRVTRGAGSGQHLTPVLQEGQKDANIDASLGFIWRISAKRLADSVRGQQLEAYASKRAQRGEHETGKQRNA